jgi:23S rRNA (cytidine1920-2'-O)/16S rRNA (cytidine1409-2'-O)-methyltransferase
MRPTTQRLDEVVAAHAGVSRSRARSLILAGRVQLGGRVLTKPGANVDANAALEIERARPFVSRGGEKLEGALEAFGLDISGARALDVGASTGGFTDCLLARGAAHVVALDVGYGQIAWPLRTDARVTVVERCNFRLLPDDAYGPEFDIVTIDASFISVVTLIARARAFLAPGGSLVALVKPQFEAGRERLGSGGVVRDPAVHRAILREVTRAVGELGLVPRALARSPLVGPAGNVEFFLLASASGASLEPGTIDALVSGGAA